jgi:hypothetical protein
MRFVLAAVSVAAALATLAAGCSEPVPPSPDGAFYLATTQDDPLACHVAGHADQVGTIDSTERSNVVTDGMNGTSVVCAVSSTSSDMMSPPFKVHAKIDDLANSANYLEFRIDSISPSNKMGSPAVGTLTFSDPRTAGEPYGGNCNFYFEGSEGIDAGKIWVSFECDALSQGMSTCPLHQGYAILENCLTTDDSAE